MDRYSAARLMGHSSPKTTDRYYVHVTDSHVCEGFGKFADYQTAKMEEALRPSVEAVQ